MRTFDELEQSWLAAGPLPRGRGTVRLICLRTGGGAHRCPSRVTLSVDAGILGDRWSAAPAPDPAKQVTLMSMRAAELVAGDHAPLDAAGDNFLVDLDLAADLLPAGSVLAIGSARIEVSAHPHLGCMKFRDRFGDEALRWVNAPAQRIRRLRGVNCRVVAGGEVSVGDAVELVAPRSLDSRV